MAAPRVPVWDNHFHLDPAGRGVDAVKEFARAGGTHLMLVHKPYRAQSATDWRFNTTVAQHVEQMETTLALAETARRAVPEVKVFVALAPHPAEFTKHLEAGATMEEAERTYRGALEAAQRFVREGRAVAMAEVGRPHWRPVPDDVMAKANDLMRYAFELARDAGCAVQIHAETATPESFADLAQHARAAGIPLGRVVKHYSTPIVDTALNHGLWPSVLIGKGAAEEAAAGGTRFLMETDYMDLPKRRPWIPSSEEASGSRLEQDSTIVRNNLLYRGSDGQMYEILPGTSDGAVLGPKTVPRRTRELITSGVMTEEQAWIIHAQNPKSIYGVDVML